MKTLKTQGNFLVILNEDSTEFSRHPLWDSRFQIYEETSGNPLIKFFGVESEFNSKTNEVPSFRFNELLDSLGLPFATVDDLITWLSDNLGFLKGGGNGQGVTSLNGVEDQNATNVAQLLTPDTYSTLLNNGLGASTLIDFLPTGVSSTWDVVNNQFDFSSLTVGTWITLRLDFDITTTVGNTDFTCAMDFIIGQVNTFEKVLGRRFFKQNKAYLGETITFGFYIGSEATKNNPAKIKVKTDSNSTFKLNGWAMGINLK